MGYLTLYDLDLLKVFGYVNYYIFEYITLGDEFEKFDGYCNLSRPLRPTLKVIKLRRCSFNNSISTLDILKKLRELNSAFYSSFGEIINHKANETSFGDPYDYNYFFEVISECDKSSRLLPAYYSILSVDFGELPSGDRFTYLDALEMLSDDIDYTHNIDNLNQVDCCVNTEEYHKVLSNNSYTDKDGVLVNSPTEVSIVNSLVEHYNLWLKGINSNKSLRNSLSQLYFRYEDWAWYLSRLDSISGDNKDVVDELLINHTMGAVAGVSKTPKASLNYANIDSYEFENLSLDKINIINTKWGKLGISFGKFNYSVNEKEGGSPTISLWNNTVFQELYTDGNPPGYIEVTEQGIGIYAERLLSLNGKNIGNAATPFYLCDGSYGGFCGDCIRLIFDEFELYLEGSLLPYLMHKASVADWVKDKSVLYTNIFDRMEEEKFDIISRFTRKTT